MTLQGTDKYGDEFKRTYNDFHFRKLKEDNYVCNICHGAGAKIEFEYVTRDYRSPRTKKICKNLQAHRHCVWICPDCLDNLVNKSRSLVKE